MARNTVDFHLQTDRTMSLMWLVLSDLRRLWPGLLITDVLYKLAALTLIAPLVGLTIHAVVATSGSAAVADQEIIYLLLRPVGLVGLLVVAALTLAIVALEQACLMALVGDSNTRRDVRSVSAILFGLRRTLPITNFLIRLIARVLLIVVPFLAAAAGIYYVLLREHDINYYLAQRPTQFWVAAALGAVLLAGLMAMLVPRLIAWSFSLPGILFEGQSPAGVFAWSVTRTRENRWRIGVAYAILFLAYALLSAALFELILLLARTLVPRVSDSLQLLVPLAGVLLFVWVAGGLVLNFLQTATFALVTMRLFSAYGNPAWAGSLSGIAKLETASPIFRLTIRRLLWVLLIAAAASIVLGVVLLERLPLEDETIVIAHRGAAAVAPENTMAAFERAITDGADFIELDVQETADGEVVVMHDSDFMKIAGRGLKIWNATYEEIAAIDIGSWYGPEFSNERVPTLRQVLEAVKNRVKVVIELKHYGHAQRLEERVVEIVEATGMANDVMLMSLNYESVTKAKVLRPEWSVGLLAAKAVGDLTRLDADFLAVNASMGTRRFMRRTHERGKDLYLWTVNDTAQMSRYMSMGIDGIITDDPAQARSLLTQRAGMNVAERLVLSLAAWVGVPVKSVEDAGRV